MVGVLVEPAEIRDYPALAGTSRRAFDHDVNFGAPGPGGPPGYDSLEWHRQAFTWGRVFRLVEAARIVGGAIVIERAGRQYELGRIWLEPSAQGRGLGAAAVLALEAMFPHSRSWVLETPCWNHRTRRFYRNLGYREVGRTPDEVHFEKLSPVADHT